MGNGTLRILRTRCMRFAGAVAAATVLLAVAALPAGALARAKKSAAPKAGTASASLAQCVIVGPQAERSATFAGEMTMLPGAARMQMRIELTERAPGELAYHAVGSPQLSDWRSSSPGVKIFKYLKQVTDLAAPADYRGSVRFRWLTAKGHVLRSEQLRTSACVQPEETQPSSGGTTAPTAPTAPAPGSGQAPPA